MKLNEKYLRHAAKIAEQYAMEHLPKEQPHDFSEQFEHNMDVLGYRMQKGTIKTDRVKMGLQYYTKRGTAAVLLGFLLTCAVMPEAVIAGYQKMIEVVERFVLDDARTVTNEYTDINTATDFAADDTYLYYQGQEGEIYRRPLHNLSADSERLTLMTVDKNYVTEDYAIGKLYEENGNIYLYYYTGGAIMGSGHQYRMHSDGTVDQVFRGKYSFYDFGEFQILADEAFYFGNPPRLIYIDETGKRDLGEADYFYRYGKMDESGTTLGRATIEYWNHTLYVLAFRYGEASRICSVDLKTGKTTPIGKTSIDNFELENGKAYYACAYKADGVEEEDFRVKHLYMLNVKNGKETYIGKVKWDAYAQAMHYEAAKNGVYYVDCDTEELVFYNSKKKTTTAMNPGAKLEKLYRQNDYIVAHFAEQTTGYTESYRLMVFDKDGTAYSSTDISDKATINQEGVMIYRIAETNQLIKAQL